MRAARQRGFTLLELIVAAGILALIAVFSWRGLDTLIREREAIAASQATIDVLQRSFARLERDAQIASDVQLDGAGTMRLVTASPDGESGATVEYRLVAGTLTRSVAGVDRAPLVMLEGFASLAMEAWSPGVRGGGAWVASRGMAAGQPSTSNPARPGAATNAAGGTGNVAAPPTPAPGTLPAPPPSPNPLVAAAPALAAATGVRIALTRADGSVIVRAFMVGGA